MLHALHQATSRNSTSTREAFAADEFLATLFDAAFVH
jgi:hypothetical protein